MLGTTLVTRQLSNDAGARRTRAGKFKQACENETGKPAIAYSLCEWLEANNRLGASFFRSRVSPSCCNLDEIVPTIAYQLGGYSPAFQSALCMALEDNPDAGKLNVVRQFKELVQEPMLAGKDTMPESVVVVIDALDECDDYGVRLVLEIS